MNRTDRGLVFKAKLLQHRQSVSVGIGLLMLLALLFGVFPVHAATAYAVSVSTDKGSYFGQARISISGNISPIPPSPPVVFVKNPQGVNVFAVAAKPDPQGNFFAAADPSSNPQFWTSGTYIVNATYSDATSKGTAQTSFIYSVAQPTSDAITVNISPATASGSDALTISGSVVAVSGSPSASAVTVLVKNPNQAVVAGMLVNPSSTGSYSTQLVTGGTSNWIVGTYVVTATYASSPTATPATATVFFKYSVVSQTFTVTSPAVTASIAGIPGIQVGYKNGYSTTISALVWVSVTNSKSQTVGIYAGSLVIHSQESITAFIPTLGLPPGNYTASVFPTTFQFAALCNSTATAISA